MTNAAQTVLYTGVTTDIETRVNQHRAGEGGEFTRKYRCHKLVYLEEFHHVSLAIEREKQIKAGSRADKVALINSINPAWQDLAKMWTRSVDEIASSERPIDVYLKSRDDGGRSSSQ